MSTYPTTLDTFTNPSPNDPRSGGTSLTTFFINATDAISALEAKVGANSSAVTTSHDYKLSGVTGSDKAVSKTGTETLTNKTLTSPVINLGSDATGDIYYRNSGGALTRLPIGTSGQILQVSSGGIPEYIANPSAADASTTVKGVVEEATLAETLARTTTGSTSARLFVNPSTLTTVKVYDYVASATGTDTYAISVTPAPTAYVTGQKFTFKADVANTAAATLNVNSLGAITIKKNVNVDLVTGDILANQIITVVYDGTNFQLDGAKTSGLSTAVSKSWGTIYQADTDGFVVAYFTSDSGAGATTKLVSDSNATPTTIRAYHASASSGETGTMMCPVKAGDYYQAATVTNSPTGTQVYFWPFN